MVARSAQRPVCTTAHTARTQRRKQRETQHGGAVYHCVGKWCVVLLFQCNVCCCCWPVVRVNFVEPKTAFCVCAESSSGGRMIESGRRALGARNKQTTNNKKVRAHQSHSSTFGEQHTGKMSIECVCSMLGVTSWGGWILRGVSTEQKVFSHTNSKEIFNQTDGTLKEANVCTHCVCCGDCTSHPPNVSIHFSMWDGVLLISVSNAHSEKKQQSPMVPNAQCLCLFPLQ